MCLSAYTYVCVCVRARVCLTAYTYVCVCMCIRTHVCSVSLVKMDTQITKSCSLVTPITITASIYSERTKHLWYKYYGLFVRMYITSQQLFVAN